MISIIIPCYNEPQLLSTCRSLDSCVSIPSDTEVLVVLNDSEVDAQETKEYNRRCLAGLATWIAYEQRSTIQFTIIDALGLPAKHAGVGLARKIGMEYAVSNESQTAIRHVLVNLDADCYVSDNYLQIIDHAFTHGDIKACSIYFEHPLPDINDSEPIIAYESFLRLYLQGLRWAGYPLAFHTVGSSMAVLASVYRQVGGMNRRKAGEDFYFIQKLLKVGDYCDLVDAMVYPSGRASHRVPFGTGKAVADIRSGMQQKTYSFRSYRILKQLLEQIPEWYASPARVTRIPKIEPFLQQIGWNDKMKECRANTKDIASFRKRFYHFFDGFVIMKLMHYLRDTCYPNVSISDGLQDLLSARGNDLVTHSFLDNRQGLRYLRSFAQSYPMILDSKLNAKPHV